MLRLLKFLGFFSLLLGIIFLLVVYPNRDAFLVVFNNGDALAEGADWAMKAKSVRGIAEFMQENPEYLSYMSSTLPGDPAHPDTASYQADTPRVLGMLSSALLTHMLFRQHQDSLDAWLEQQVWLEQVNDFQLPNIYQTAHENALARMEQDQVLLEGTKAKNADLLASMLISNDLAIHDYFLSTLADSTQSQLFESLGVQQTDPVLPQAGLYLMIHPTFREMSVDQVYDWAQKTSSTERWNWVRQVYYPLKNDQAAWFAAKELTQDKGKDLKFDQERDLSNYLPKTTASDLHQWLTTTYNSPLAADQKFITFIQETNRNTYRKRIFSTYAGVFDNRIGMQNGLDWGAHLEDDQARIQVIFMDQLPIGFWFHLSSDLILQDVQQRMIWDQELRKLLPKTQSFN